MGTVSAFLILIWLHWLSDFVFQTDAMAKGKSKSSKMLALHVCAYVTCFLWLGWKFALVTWVAHFCTDYVSSRITSRLWAAKQVHWFFVVVGLDQALHMTQLVLTYEWLVRQ